MRITTIQATGFQGQDLEVSVDRAVVLFAGPNGSGKSTRLRAVQAAIVGAGVPGDRSRVRLGPQPSGHVSLSVGGGALHRDLAEGATTKRGKAAAGTAREWFGDGLVSTDIFDAFAEDTEKGRRELLRAVCSAAGSGAGWTAERIRAYLLGALGAPSTVLDATSADGPPHPLAALLGAHPTGKMPMGEWLQAAQEFVGAGGLLTQVNAEEKQARAAVEAMAADKSPTVWGDLAQKRAEADAAQARLQAAITNRVALEAQDQEAWRWNVEHQVEGEQIRARLAQAERPSRAWPSSPSRTPERGAICPRRLRSRLASGKRTSRRRSTMLFSLTEPPSRLAKRPGAW